MLQNESTGEGAEAAISGSHSIRLYQHLIPVLAGFAWVILAWLVATSPEHRVYDEIFFLPNNDLYREHGLTREFLLNIERQSPGPLYQVVHGFAEAWTGGTTPQVRWVSYFLLLATTIPLYGVIRKRSSGSAAELALVLLTVPVLWRLGGAALTEVPTLFFASCALFGITRSATLRNPILQLLACAATGLCIGIAACGRIPFLGLAAILPLLSIGGFLPWRAIITLALFAVPLPVALMVMWGGYMPPKGGQVVEGGISLVHAVLGFGYVGLTIALLNPAWFVIKRGVIYAVAVVTVLALVLNVFWWKVPFLPMSDLAAAWFGLLMSDSLALLTLPCMIGLSAWALFSFIVHGFQNRADALYWYCFLAAAGLSATTMLVTAHFSSRYAMQAIPFLIIGTWTPRLPTQARLLFSALGIFLGAFSLNTLYSHDYSEWHSWFLPEPSENTFMDAE